MAKYGVFIIETLRSDDYFDGETLYEILDLTDIPARYEPADTIDDWFRLIKDFSKSNFRYLHLSCHADREGFEINGDELSNGDFQKMTLKHLVNKRVFLSACKGGNLELASHLILKNKAYSVIGTPENLRFDKSVLFWPSFYHAMNEIDNKRMTKKSIIHVLKKCVDLFEVPINYYSKIENDSQNLWRLRLRSNQRSDNRTIKSVFK